MLLAEKRNTLYWLSCYQLVSIIHLMFRFQRLFSVLLPVIFLGLGIVFSVKILEAEWWYAKSQQEIKIGNRIQDLRNAADWYKYDYQFRSASAIELGRFALNQHEFKQASLIEIKYALKDDPYSPDLLVLYNLLKD